MARLNYVFVLFNCFILMFFTPFVHTELSEERVKILPRIFEQDDPEKCSENNGLFCKIFIALNTKNNETSNVWTSTIQETNEDFRFFRHDKLQHGKCFKKNQIKKLEENLREDYANKYLNNNIQGVVEKYTCFEKGRLILNDLDYWDLFFISLAVIYGIFLVLATCYTFIAEHEKDNAVARFLSIFSVLTVWKELRKPIKNEDFQQLKSIQGLRTMTMMLIISLHAFYGNMLSFLKNPEYVENLYVNLTTRTLVSIFTFLVQTFFLISAWLLTIQLNNLIKKNGCITFKDVILLAFNRYLRLIPVVAVMIAALRSNLTYDLIAYFNEDIAKREVEICRFYWWKNFLFIHNIYQPDKICNAVTWYIATDYQLYLLVLLMFYVAHKVKIDRFYAVFVVISAAVSTQIFIISNTDFQGFLRLTPKTANLEDMLVSKSFTLSYIPIWCNIPTYMLGVIFGTIYVNYKKKNLFESNVMKAVWFVCFFGLTTLSVFLTSFQYENRVYEILISILARPTFGFGIAVGILGMSMKTGGIVRKICESEPLVFLANFCYCVYLFHYAFVFLRILRESQLVELSIFYIAKYTFIDYTLSFIFGAMIYIAIEHPFLQLQKWWIPQVTTRKVAEQVEESRKTETVIANPA